VALTGALALAAVLAAGCGPSTLVVAHGGSAPASPAGALVPAVVMAKAVDNLQYVTTDVAQRQGYFARDGVRVTEVLMGGSSQVLAALSAGHAAFGEISATALLLGRRRGVPLEAVVEESYGTPLQVVVSAPLLARTRVTAASPLRDRIRALQGAVAGSVGPTDRGAYTLLLRSIGLTPDLRYVKLLNQEAAVAAMARGEIDTFMGSPPTVFTAVLQAGGTDLINGNDVPGWGRAAFDVTVTTKSYAAAHPAVVRAVATALAEADDFMLTQPTQALGVVEQHFPNIAPPLLQQSLRIVTFAPHGRMTPAQWSAAVRLAAGEGFVPAGTRAPEGAAWTNRYISLPAPATGATASGSGGTASGGRATLPSLSRSVG
jgi:NitT/TauT family transport system substrate-binding protein